MCIDVYSPPQTYIHTCKITGYQTISLGNHRSLPQTSLRLVNTQYPSNGSPPSQTLARNSTTAQIPFMGNYNCSDDICSQFLNKSIGYYQCTRKSNGSLHDTEVLQRINGKCHFMNGSNRAPVGLISPPGSGNTWVRGLLEQATGICTGEAENGIACTKLLTQG